MQFRLGDLGVAKLLTEIDGNNTRAEWMLPPEVLQPTPFGPPDHRIDVYHCGLLVLQLAHSRELRFTNEETLAGRPREMAGQLQVPLNLTLGKALRRHVSMRTETARELWRDLISAGPALQTAPAQEPFHLPKTSQLRHQRGLKAQRHPNPV